MNIRTRFLPVNELQVGMLTARALIVVEHGLVSYSLPADHTLTQQNIGQLTLHDAICICVTHQDTRSQDEISAFVEGQSERMRIIFKPTDLAQPANRTLFDALSAYRSA